MAKSDKRRNPVLLQHGMSIGNNAAESDDEFLFDCFIHYPPVESCRDPRQPGMILGGRTGSGKTAILRNLARTEERVHEIDPGEMAMSYVANSDILNFVQAIGGDLDLFFQILWKHVLCIEFIRLRWKIEDETTSKTVFTWLNERFHRDARKKKSLQYLKAWEGQFWITMDVNIKEITEKVESKLEAELGAEIKKFKLRGQYDKQLSTDKKSELVSRARKIINSDQLSELAGVIDILHEQEDDRQKIYYLLIDRLDERWVDTTIRFRLIRALIESLRAFRRITNLKIVVALRTDIVERVMQEDKDISFQREKNDDYFIKMRWTRPLLLELIKKRIRTLFRRKYSPTDTIEFEDVFPYKVGNVEPFEYIVERTLMRPRDVIAFVNQCLLASEGSYEVSASHIRKAENEYSRIRREALEQEWRSAFPTLRRLLDFVSSSKNDSFPIGTLVDGDATDKLALEVAGDGKIDFDPMHAFAANYIDNDGNSLAFVKEILAILYRVGAIGIKLRPTERMSYSFLDEPVISSNTIPDNARVRIHPMLHAALKLTLGSAG
jgi:hypothetical protein